MLLLVVAVNSKLKTVYRKLPTNLNDLVNRFSLNIESAECMNKACESCPKYHVNENNFKEDVESSISAAESDSSKSGNHPIK